MFDSLRALTVAGANSLAYFRKIECLPDSHFSHMELLLADIHSRLLWHKLVKSVSVVCHIPFYLAFDHIGIEHVTHPKTSQRVSRAVISHRRTFYTSDVKLITYTFK